MGDRRRQDEQRELLERRLHGRQPRGERDLAESQGANARDVQPSGAGKIAEAHRDQSAGVKAAVSQATLSQDTLSQDTLSQETASQETVSQETLSHETVSHETVSPTFAAYAAAR